MEPNQDQQQSPQQDLAGYPSTEELLKGYRASSAEAKRLASELQRKEQEWAQQQAAFQEAFTQRQNVPVRRPEERLAEYGIPVDAIDELVNSRLSQALAPLARGFEARGKVLNEYPDYTKFEADVAQYVQSDPDLSRKYNALFSADPAAAMELAFLKFGEAKRRESGPQSIPSAPQRADAQIPMSRSGDARRGTEGSAQAVEDAFERYKKTGSSQDAQAYAKARLHGAIPDSFLNQ